MDVIFEFGIPSVFLTYGMRSSISFHKSRAGFKIFCRWKAPHKFPREIPRELFQITIRISRGIP